MLSARLVIYNDLDPKLWPGEVGIVGNPSILELFAGRDKGDKDGGFSADEYEVDNPTIASKVPLLITDADASQFSAIVDVMDGKNLALKGPPESDSYCPPRYAIRMPSHFDANRETPAVDYVVHPQCA